MKYVLTGILSLTASLVFSQGKPVYQQVRAEEVKCREGIGHFMEKVKAGKPVTIAYFGGSITAQNGWRVKTTGWLQKTYPNVKFTPIHAAIGGTGSDLGVFRCGHDVLAHNPDLLFVEFATNDGGAAPESIWRTMEGIVRQTWKKDPATDIVFTYTITSSMTNDYCKGLCNRSASAMEMLADHYGIPSINFGPRVAKLLNEGKLVMSSNELSKSVPQFAPDRDKQIQAIIDAEKRLVFSPEGVHPYDKGHDLYLASIVSGFTAMKDSKPADHAAKLVQPFVPDNFESAKMIPVDSSMLAGTWQKLSKTDAQMKRFENRQGQIWYSGTPGSALSFTFNGSVAKIYDLLGPDGGQVDIFVDGKKCGKPVARFDSYCTYWRIATLGICSFPESGTHTVKVVINPEQPSRQPVAFRLKNPEKELKAPLYNGTKVWFSQLMLVGDLVK